MTPLGTLTQITDLRTVWPKEAVDFTPWLAKEENLKLLGDAIGIDMVLEEKESSVGTFSVDIFAKEQESGKKIIIENQLDNTNHDHLGKLITYASGKNAEIVIWIVQKARDEHRQAIEWLNNHTDDSAAFFLIEIELWKIGDSLVAPKFNIVERPNDWAKAMRKKDGLSVAEALKLDFWTEFRNYAETIPSLVKEFSLRKPSTDHWYNFAVGKGNTYIQLTIVTPKNMIYAGIISKEDKEISARLHDAIPQLEEAIGVKAEWKPATKSDRVTFGIKAHLKNRNEWTSDFDWLIDKVLKLKKFAIQIAQ